MATGGKLFRLALLLFFYGIFFVPSVQIHMLILTDFFTSFNSITNPYAIQYQDYLLSKLPDIPEQEPTFLKVEDATKESLRIASRDYTWPVVIRGAMNDSMALEKWSDTNWWIKEYGEEDVLCKYVESGGDEPACKIKDSLAPQDPANRLYISGEAQIFGRNPQLVDMVASDLLDRIAPGKAIFTQMFMGFVGMGSDVHSAMGCNLFRQIVGEKKWWLIPPHQTPFVRPSLNPNGFSAHTGTKVGKGNEIMSPWMNKLERYVVTLKPGDVLLNPAWFWHGISNTKGSKDGLSIGVPTRYASPQFKAAFMNNWLLSTIGLASISLKYGLAKFTAGPESFQHGIESARINRMNQMSEAEEAMNRDL